MTDLEIRIGRRVWVAVPDDTGGRSCGVIVSIPSGVLKGWPGGFTVRLERRRPTVVACCEDARGEQWDFVDETGHEDTAGAFAAVTSRAPQSEHNTVMPDLETERKHLEEVDRHIADGEARVLAQQKLLEELRRDGHPTDIGERTLKALEGAVNAARGTKAVIEERLRRLDEGISPHRN